MDGTDPMEGPGGVLPARGWPDLVRRLYREEGEAWRRHYRKYFKYAARALGLGFVAGFFYFVAWPAQEKKALDFVVQSLKDIPLEAGPFVLAVTLFYHNARASVIYVATGAVPFIFLPILDPFINGGVLGLLVSMARHQGLDVPRLVLTQILPHGIFELTAVLYATSVGLSISAFTARKARAAWHKRRRRGVSPSPSPPAGLFGPTAEREAGELPEGPVRNAVRSFVLVVLPLLFVAAFIEGYITPLLR